MTAPEFGSREHVAWLRFHKPNVGPAAPFDVPGYNLLTKAVWITRAALEEINEGNDVGLHLDGLDTLLGALREEEDGSPLWSDCLDLVSEARNTDSETYRESVLEELCEVLDTEVENDNL